MTKRKKHFVKFGHLHNYCAALALRAPHSGREYFVVRIEVDLEVFFSPKADMNEFLCEKLC